MPDLERSGNLFCALSEYNTLNDINIVEGTGSHIKHVLTQDNPLSMKESNVQMNANNECMSANTIVLLPSILFT